MLDHFSSFSDDGTYLGNGDISIDTLGQYQRESGFYNNLEESISLVEKTSKKIKPIYKELLKRLVQVRPSEKNDEVIRMYSQLEPDLDKPTKRKP